MAQRPLKTGKQISGGAASAAVLAGRPDIAAGLTAAAEGMGAASQIIGHTHKAIKSDLEKPAAKTASTTGEG